MWIWPVILAKNRVWCFPTSVKTAVISNTQVLDKHVLELTKAPKVWRRDWNVCMAEWQLYMKISWSVVSEISWIFIFAVLMASRWVPRLGIWWRTWPRLLRGAGTCLCIHACALHLFAQYGMTGHLVYLGAQATCDQLEAVPPEQIPHLGCT